MAPRLYPKPVALPGCPTLGAPERRGRGVNAGGARAIGDRRAEQQRVLRWRRPRSRGLSCITPSAWHTARRIGLTRAAACSQGLSCAHQSGEGARGGTPGLPQPWSSGWLRAGCSMLGDSPQRNPGARAVGAGSPRRALRRSASGPPTRSPPHAALPPPQPPCRGARMHSPSWRGRRRPSGLSRCGVPDLPAPRRRPSAGLSARPRSRPAALVRPKPAICPAARK